MGSASATWTSGKQFVVESGTGHAVVVDSPDGAIGGRDTGMTPMEMVLASLAGCTGIDVVYLLTDKMRKQLTGLAVEVSGERRDEIPRVYTRVDVLYRVRGRELAEKDVVRALRISEQKLCSVSEMLRGTAAIRGRYVIEDADGGETVEGEL